MRTFALVAVLCMALPNGALSNMIFVLMLNLARSCDSWTSCVPSRSKYDFRVFFGPVCHPAAEAGEENATVPVPVQLQAGIIPPTSDIWRCRFARRNGAMLAPSTVGMY